MGDDRRRRRRRASPGAGKDPGEATVSIHEVADAAAVSVATVSRVLNDKGPVREDTRRSVLTAVERLGYVPHGAARSLITRQTRTIGVVLPDIYGEFFSELIRGADLAARRAGFHLLVSGAHSGLSETREVLRTLHGRVDGLVLMAPVAGSEALDHSLPRRVPVVLLNHAGKGTGQPSIRIDNRGGARAMTDHLLGHGHRRIALVLGPVGNQDAVERRRGYREALAACGIAPDPELEIAGDFSEESGHRAGWTLADKAPRPTAVFAANDQMAIGCLAGLRERGLRVPEDVALAGFDDIPIARYVTPPLTTVRVAIAELGARAMTRLLEALEPGDRHPRRHEVLPTTVVVRASCGGDHPPSSPRGGEGDAPDESSRSREEEK